MLASSDCKNTAHKLAVQEDASVLTFWKMRDKSVSWRSLSHLLINLDADSMTVVRWLCPDYQHH